MKPSRSRTLRILLALAIAFSLLSLPGAFSKNLGFLNIPSVWALRAPCPTHGSTGVCSEYWYPAGPAMDTEQITIFPGANSEGNCPPLPIACFQPGLQTDLTDSPISQVNVLNDSSVYITSPVGGHGSSGQFAYGSNWQRVVNDENVGIPNYFTWLDAYSPNPLLPLTVRQAFASTTQSLNPYVASTARDFYVVGNIYDSLDTLNPLNSAQLVNWMTVSSSQTALSNSQLTYTPPPGTVGTYRFILRGDMFFQDGFKVNAFDIAFSYLSLKATGAFQAGGASSMTGITILGPSQFDIGVSSPSFATEVGLTSLSILPGHLWTSAGSSAWNSEANSCTSTSAACYPAQYTLGPTPPTGGSPPAQCSLTCVFPASAMNVDPAKTSPSYDPVLNHVLDGSGPWTCGVVTSIGSGACSSSGQENPFVGGTYTLSRFGSGIMPGSSVSGEYFRSSGNLALWIWSGDNGDITHDFLNFAAAANCFGKPTGPPCIRWQEGMGAPGGPIPLGLVQISIIARFVGVNWTSPFSWQSNPPTGVAPFPGPPPLILYAGTTTLNPASVVGCPAGYDC